MIFSMKRFTYIVLVAATVTGIYSCSNNPATPGRVYMPDMAYSRAYESYALLDSTKFTLDPTNKGDLIFYNSATVPGTIRRGDELPYTLPNDSNGYRMSATVRNPFDTTNISGAEMAEMGRLYDINCGICHGAKGTADGPLSTSGKVGGVANLTLPNYISMADGTMFHSITYGKGNMGSYASQLTRAQRWKIIKYVRTLQGGGKPAAGADSTAAGAAAPGATAASGTSGGTDSTANQ